MPPRASSRSPGSNSVESTTTVACILSALSIRGTIVWSLRQGICQ